jgi:hypothetical protein
VVKNTEHLNERSAVARLLQLIQLSNWKKHYGKKRPMCWIFIIILWQSQAGTR